jgi:hypothetical protein
LRTGTAPRTSVPSGSRPINVRYARPGAILVLVKVMHVATAHAPRMGRVVAIRLIFSTCMYVTLSVVDVPPNVPQPSVIDGASPLLSPTTPCVLGGFTRMRLARISAAKRWMRATLRVWMIAVCPRPSIASCASHTRSPASASVTVNRLSTSASFSVARQLSQATRSVGDRQQLDGVAALNSCQLGQRHGRLADNTQLEPAGLRVDRRTQKARRLLLRQYRRAVPLQFHNQALADTCRDDQVMFRPTY